MKKRMKLCFAAALFIAVCCTKENTTEFNPKDYKGGVYELDSLPSDGLLKNGIDGEFSIYLPDGCMESNGMYPVLYLLHGLDDNNKSWQEKGGVVEMTDEAIRAGIIKPFIIVMPKAYNSFYVDGFEYGYQYETFFFEKLMPYVKANYPVRKDREHTAIAGLSMGGYGASLYAFKYPELFCMAYSMSGATQGYPYLKHPTTPSVEDIFEEKGYTEDDFNSLPAYFMDCGTEDPICKAPNDATHAYLEGIGFPHEFREYVGKHEWEYWIACYKRMLPDLAVYFDR